MVDIWMPLLAVLLALVGAAWLIAPRHRETWRFSKTADSGMTRSAAHGARSLPGSRGSE